MNFISNIKSQYAAGVEPDSGELVQVVIIVSSFAVVSVFVVASLAGAFQSKGNDAEGCLTEINPSSYNAKLVKCDTFTPSGVSG